MDFKAELTQTLDNLDNYLAEEPHGASAFAKLQKAAMTEGALSVREKELIALAIGIARQCADCIGFHTKAAIKAGASKEQIAETVTVSMLMGGGPAYMYGARALEAYDQFTGADEA